MDTNGNYIQNQFCNYEISLKLKELGFDEPCLGYYEVSNNLRFGFRLRFIEHEDNNPSKQPLNKDCLAPLWQQAERWFRDTYNYHIVLYRLNNRWCGDVYSILRQCYITSNAFDNILHNTYEEAYEQIILKAIELCQKEK